MPLSRAASCIFLREMPICASDTARRSAVCGLLCMRGMLSSQVEAR